MVEEQTNEYNKKMTIDLKFGEFKTTVINGEFALIFDREIDIDTLPDTMYYYKHDRVKDQGYAFEKKVTKYVASDTPLDLAQVGLLKSEDFLSNKISMSNFQNLNCIVQNNYDGIQFDTMKNKTLDVIIAEPSKDAYCKTIGVEDLQRMYPNGYNVLNIDYNIKAMVSADSPLLDDRLKTVDDIRYDIKNKIILVGNSESGIQSISSENIEKLLNNYTWVNRNKLVTNYMLDYLFKIVTKVGIYGQPFEYPVLSDNMTWNNLGYPFSFTLDEIVNQMTNPEFREDNYFDCGDVYKDCWMISKENTIGFKLNPKQLMYYALFNDNEKYVNYVLKNDIDTYKYCINNYSYYNSSKKQIISELYDLSSSGFQKVLEQNVLNIENDNKLCKYLQKRLLGELECIAINDVYKLLQINDIEMKH